MFISCGLILEEGFPRSDLDTILASMREAAGLAGVEVVTGDTKVLPRGKADRIFINTGGIGIFPEGAPRPDAEIRPGDAVLVSGTMGDHGAAVLSCREGLNLESTLLSDCAPVTEVARAVLDTSARCSFLRDVTRGGLATILNEAALAAGLDICLREAGVPVRAEVRAVCELLGLDPLYLACEGRVAAVVDAESADAVVEAVRRAPGGAIAFLDNPGERKAEARLELKGETLPAVPLDSGSIQPFVFDWQWEGNVKLAYSTAAVFTTAQFGRERIAILYGRKNEKTRTAFDLKSKPQTAEGA
jgi:hydrogenase expression/formation protein HypE